MNPKITDEFGDRWCYISDDRRADSTMKPIYRDRQKATPDMMLSVCEKDKIQRW
jgi:hypothetical protein